VAQLRFFLGEAWEYFHRGRGATFSAVLALTAVLFLLALVLLAMHNVQSLAGRLQSRKALWVFLVEGASEERARGLQEAIGRFGEVAEVKLVDREEELAEIERDLGGFPVVSALGENPLPQSLVVTLTPAAAARRGALQSLASEIRSYADVEDVIYGEEWVEILDQNLRTLSRATLAVGGLAAVSVFVVLLTTLRLVFLGRRETVRILKMVGATDRFIRMPFLILGGLQSVFSAGLALVVLAVARAVFEAFLPGARFLPASWQALFLLGSLACGVLASMVSVEPALRSLETQREEVAR
jgi:cell division transport system permease protein